MDLLSKRKSPRLKDFDYSQPYIYFITICTFKRQNIFTNHKFNQDVIQCLLEERNRLGVKIFAYCLMPDHIHFIIQPETEGADVPQFICSFKSKIYQIQQNYGKKRKIWQPRFYDHIIRKKESLIEIMKYILNNPVRKNLVESWDEYLYSGYVDKIE